MSWLKRGGAAFLMAITAFLAFFAAMNATAKRKQAQDWQKRAEGQAESDMVGDIVSADAALTQAKVHAAEAERIAQKAEKRIDEMAKRDETVADIVDRWRADRLRNG